MNDILIFIVTSCDAGKEGAGDTPELGMDNVGGVFLVLACGLGISILIGILEFMWNVSKVSVAEKVGLFMKKYYLPHNNNKMV